MKTFRFLSMVLVASAVAGAGCRSILGDQTTQTVLDTVDASTEQAEAIIQAIRLAEVIFFSANPNADAQRKVERAIADAELARAAVIASRSAAAKSDTDPVAAAQDFGRAWSALKQLLLDAGIAVPRGTAGVAKNGVAPIVLPEPLLLKGTAK